MRTKILIILFSLFAFILNAQTESQRSDSWDYPVKPGTAEWKEALDRNEIFEVCQIPFDVLKNMTTQELVKACLDYPLKIQFYMFGSLPAGFKIATEFFTGWQELLRRDDNVQCLLELLQENTFETLPEKNLSNNEIGFKIVLYTLTEVMISHESVIPRATPAQLDLITDIAAKNLSIKEQWPEAYSRLSLEASAYLLCAGLKSMNGIVLPSNLELSLQTGLFRNDDLIDELKQFYSKTFNQ